MAEPIDLEFRVSGNAEQGLRSMRGELQGVEQATTSTGGSWGNLSQQITAGVIAVQAATGAIKGMASSLVSAAEEIERTSGIFNRFQGDVSVALDRTNGLFTSLQLMTAQQKAVQAGLNLTAEQFATLAVAANESASALGTDNVQALNRLVQAMATGRSGALREFGIDIRGITDAAEIQAEVMGRLGDQYGEVESKADTAAGRLLNLGNALEEVKIEAARAAGETQDLNVQIDELKREIEELTKTGLIPLATIEFPNLTDAIEIFNAALATSVDQLRKVLEGLNAILDGNILSGLERMSEALVPDIAGALDRQQQSGAARAISAQERRDRRLLEAGAPETAFGARPGLIGGAVDLGTSGAANVSGGGGGRRRGSRGGGGAANDNGGPLLEGMGGDVGAILAELQGELAEQNEADLLAQNEATEEAIDLAEVRAQQERDRAEFQRQINQQIEREIQLRQQVVSQIAGGGQKLLKLVGATQGQMELWNGAAEVAKSIGSYPDPVGIVQHGLAAALHFKNAAEMGVGGGGEAKAQAGRAQGGRNARPQRPGGFGAGGSPGSGAQQTINVNMPFPESQIGRANRYFERQSVRRFGSVRAA